MVKKDEDIVLKKVKAECGLKRVVERPVRLGGRAGLLPTTLWN